MKRSSAELARRAALHDVVSVAPTDNERRWSSRRFNRDVPRSVNTSTVNVKVPVPLIGPVKAVVYVRGADAADEADAAYRCRTFADTHDWAIPHIIYERSDDEAPLTRTGFTAVLALLRAQSVGLVLVASPAVIGDDQAFGDVQQAVAEADGFLYVIDP